MKIIKEGSVSMLPNGSLRLEGWHVEGGTDYDLWLYAKSKLHPYFQRVCIY